MHFSNNQKFELVKLLLDKDMRPDQVLHAISQIESGLQNPSNGEIGISLSAVAPESIQKLLEDNRGAMQAVITKSQNSSSFVHELNDLCHKHGVYLASVEGKQGLSVLPIEPHMHSSGYAAQPDGQIDFDWH